MPAGAITWGEPDTEGPFMDDAAGPDRVELALYSSWYPSFGFGLSYDVDLDVTEKGEMEELDVVKFTLFSNAQPTLGRPVEPEVLRDLDDRGARVGFALGRDPVARRCRITDLWGSGDRRRDRIRPDRLRPDDRIRPRDR